MESSDETLAATTATTAASATLARISREMTRIYKEQFGRGPVTVRSAFAGSDAVVSFIGGSLTRAECTLAAMGEHQSLRATRTLYQAAAETEMREAVEEATGRTVIAFVSGIDTTADVATETFLLEPEEPT